ncbi:acetyl-coenzyme A synthetase N-terminal domain-containing protein, partial [Runella sp.]|uniref:acetyl-coenzyme A synthetase N-terminal domain-containing protein n=1 Tax=Runella sp. TaxID=1960881 RepID=UPI003019FF37
MPYEAIYHHSIENPESFWAAQAEKIHWFKAPEQILSKDEHDFYRWFKGGQLNTCYLALDYHVENGRGDQVALYYDSPVTQTFHQYTYRELLQETARFAGVLRDMGVEKGDRVIIYMPMIPQVVVA